MNIQCIQLFIGMKITTNIKNIIYENEFYYKPCNYVKIHLKFENKFNKEIF